LAKTFDPDSEEEDEAEGEKPAVDDDFTMEKRDRRSLNAIELQAARNEQLRVDP